MASWGCHLRAPAALGSLLAMSMLLQHAAALSTSSSSCAVPRAPQFLPLPRCKPSNKTIEDAKKVAWQFAPIIYPHPMEQYHLQDPQAWFEASELFQQDLRAQNESDFAWFNQSATTELQFMPRSFRTVLNASSLTEEQRKAVIAGAPYDARGRSTANVTYTVAEVYEDAAGTKKVPGLWLYNYNLYYSWNGCSNQDLALSLDGELQVVQYVMCPTGVHEGDWEHVSVLVCAEDLSLQQASYSQHEWWETRDCAAGQCPTEVNENDPAGAVRNPVSHIGFESHANYYEEAPLMVYAWKNASFKGIQLDNLGGLWVGDRTLRDPARKFVPSPDNIQWVPNITEIGVAPEWSWARYPGNWGAPLQGGKVSFVCIGENQTYTVSCPDNAATRALSSAFKIFDVVSSVTGGGDTTANYYPGFDTTPFRAKEAANSSWVAPASITGPLFRTWSYQWLPERHSPVFNDFPNAGDVVICPEDSIVTIAYPDYNGALNPATTVDSIVNYLVAICVGSIVISLIFVLLMVVPSLASKAAEAPAVITAFAGRVRTKAKGYGKAAAGVLVGGWRKSSQAAAIGQTDAGDAGEGDATDGASGSDSPASSKAAAPAAAPCKPSASSVQEMEVNLPETESGMFFLWTMGAALLYIAAVVLLVLGTDQYVNHSVASLAMDLFGHSAPLEAVEWLIIGSLILAGICDAFAAYTILLSHRKHITVHKWTVRNWLYSSWMHHHTWKIHAATAGLVILVISVCCILFGLGLIVMTLQLASRVACSTLARLNIDDIRVSDVCVTAHSLSEEPICGWQALAVCYEATKMGVMMLALGAMLLLWAHIVLLAELLLSMHRYKTWRVRVERGADSDGGAVGGGDAGADSSSDSLSLELGPPAGSIELAVGKAEGGAPASASA